MWFDPQLSNSLRTFDQIWDRERNTFKTFENLKTEFDLSGWTFLDYFHLCKSIPGQWLLILEIPGENNSLPGKVGAKPKVSKIAYAHLKSQVLKAILPMEKRIVREGINVDRSIILKEYEKICCLSRDVKIQSFIIKCWTGLIFTRDRLYYWNKANTQACNFCGKFLTKQCSPFCTLS